MYIYSANHRKASAEKNNRSGQHAGGGIHIIAPHISSSNYNIEKQLADPLMEVEHVHDMEHAPLMP
jgi:hypothetical protein